MTLYSRSDIEYINVSPAHGGCGSDHRPQRGSDGSYLRPWALTCHGGCETFLRKDSNWSATISEIPETPDQTAIREDWEKRGVHDLQYVQAIAAATQAKLPIPESLTKALERNSGIRLFTAGAETAAITGTMVCPAGHDADPGSKFCGECGSPMRRPPALACPEGHPVRAGVKFCSECGSSVVAAIEAVPAPAAQPEAPAPANGARKKPLKDMRLTDLQAKAREKGLDDTGTRADLLARLRAA